MLAFLNTFMYNTACRHDIGLSPSGKALDSDSSTSGVRIPQAQLETSRITTRGFFVRVAMRIDVERPQPCSHGLRTLYGYSRSTATMPEQSSGI